MKFTALASAAVAVAASTVALIPSAAVAHAGTHQPAAKCYPLQDDTVSLSASRSFVTGTDQTVRLFGSVNGCQTTGRKVHIACSTGAKPENQGTTTNGKGQYSGSIRLDGTTNKVTCTAQLKHGNSSNPVTIRFRKQGKKHH
jgi:hypothetical protein